MNYALVRSCCLFAFFSYDDDNNGKHNVWPEEKTILLPLHPGLELELSGKKIPCYTIQILPQKNARCRLCT